MGFSGVGMMGVMADEGFEMFVRHTERRLLRALAGHVATDGVRDAAAEAYAHAWEHWERVRVMENPVGYLFRVAQSRSRRRLAGHLPSPDSGRTPLVEPSLVSAMHALPSQQRSSVWLVHACGFTYGEAAEALGISASAVGTHVSRALTALRSSLGVATDG